MNLTNIRSVISLLWLRKILLALMVAGIGSFLPLSWLGFILPKTILMGFSLGALFLFISIKGGKMYTHGKILLFVLGYFVIILLATILSPAPVSSFFGVSGAMQGFQNQLLYVGAFLLIVSLEKKEYVYILKCLLILHLLAGFYALLQWLRLDPLSFIWKSETFLYRTFSFFGNPNWLAAFIVLTMPLLFLKNTLTPRISWIIIIFDWLILFSTGSKAGFLAGIIVTIALLRESLKKYPTTQIKILRNIFLLVAFIVAGTGLTLKIFYPDTSLLFRSFESRQILWQDTVSMIKNNPWGHGLETFTFYYPQHTNPALFEFENIASTSDMPHNQALLLLFESGPAGLLFFYGVILIIVFLHFHTSSQKSLLAWGIIGYLITNFFGFDTVATGFTFWLLVGALARFESSPTLSSQPYGLKLIPKIAFGIMGIIFLHLSFGNITHLIAHVSYHTGWAYVQQKNPQGIPFLQDAITLYPYDRVYLLQASETLLALENPTSSQLQSVETYLHQAQTLSNNLDPEIPILKAWQYAHQGDDIKAEQYFNEAQQKYPTKLRTYLIGFEIFKLLKKPEKITELKIALKNVLPSYWNKPETESGRIFQKNYPWIKNVLAEVH